MKAVHRSIFICLLMVAQPCFAQSFITQVSSKTIGKNDLLEVQYVAENLDLSDFILSKFPGWLVQSGPNFSSNRVQTGSIIKQQIIYSVLLQPTRSGKLSVPSATIVIDKHTSRQSNTVTIDVKATDHVTGNQQNANAGSQPSQAEPLQDEEAFIKEQVLRRGESPVTKIKNNLLVKLDVSKTSCYVGEPVIATYKLCTRLRSQSKVVKQPEFSGCTVVELTTDQTVPTHESINGKMYNVYVIRRVQLIPLQAGDLVLPQASVENKVSFFKEEEINYRDLFYNPSSAGIEQQVTLTNTAGIVHVKQLPLPQPAAFDGAVGRFAIASAKTEKAVTVNNNAAFSVAIEGTGNLQQIKAPDVLWPAGIEAFEPLEREEFDKSSSPVRIRKTFTYPFIVNKKGLYTIPAISFCYFNPEANKYELVKTLPVSLEVKKGSLITLPNSNFLSTSDFQTRLYILVIAGFIAIVGGLYWFNKRQAKKNVSSPAKENKVEETETALPEVNVAQFIQYIRHLNPIEDDGYYKQLRRYITSFLTGKYNVEEDEIAGLSGNHPAQKDTLTELELLLRNCSLGMYTPVFDAEEAMKHRLLAIELLSRLENV